MKNLGLSLRTKCGLKWAVENAVGGLSYVYDAAGRRTLGVARMHSSIE